KYLRRLHRNHFRLPAKASHRHDRFADERTVHILAGCLDYTTNLVSHHTRLRRRVGIQTLTRENVGKIQTSRTNANDNLTLTRRRIRLLLDLKHVDVARASRYYLSHKPILAQY